MTVQTLKEVNAPYTVNPEDDAVGRETILIRRNGEPVAAVLPYSEYATLIALKQAGDAAMFQQGHDDYLRLHPDLLNTHRGRWVAVWGGQVVDSDADHWALAERVYRHLGYRPIYMTQVGDQPVRTVEMGGPAVAH